MNHSGIIRERFHPSRAPEELGSKGTREQGEEQGKGTRPLQPFVVVISPTVTREVAE